MKKVKITKKISPAPNTWNDGVDINGKQKIKKKQIFHKIITKTGTKKKSVQNEWSKMKSKQQSGPQVFFLLFFFSSFSWAKRFNIVSLFRDYFLFSFSSYCLLHFITIVDIFVDKKSNRLLFLARYFMWSDGVHKLRLNIVFMFYRQIHVIFRM